MTMTRKRRLEVSNFLSKGYRGKFKYPMQKMFLFWEKKIDSSSHKLCLSFLVLGAYIPYLITHPMFGYKIEFRTID